MKRRPLSAPNRTDISKTQGLELARYQRTLSRKQQTVWLGHVKSDTTDWYESFDPEFLREVAIVTEIVITKLDNIAKPTFAPKSVKQRGLRVAGANMLDCVMPKDRIGIIQNGAKF